MEKTFGPVLFNMIHRKIPKERYILFDTKKKGRQLDTMQMLKDIYVAFSAEGEYLPLGWVGFERCWLTALV